MNDVTEPVQALAQEAVVFHALQVVTLLVRVPVKGIVHVLVLHYHVIDEECKCWEASLVWRKLPAYEVDYEKQQERKS